MKGNFSQQKFSRSHFLMHSSRFVPLRWHCSCCQSVKGNVLFHLSTMAWPCVLSWSRVAKAISRERRVDSSQNEEQNYRINISYTVLHIQNNEKHREKSRNGPCLVDNLKFNPQWCIESWHDVDWLPVWIATIEGVACCPSCPNSHQRPSTPAAWWACHHVAEAEHRLPTHLSCWFGFSVEKKRGKVLIQNLNCCTMFQENGRHCYCHFTFIHCRPNRTIRKKNLPRSHFCQKLPMHQSNIQTKQHFSHSWLTILVDVHWPLAIHPILRASYQQRWQLPAVEPGPATTSLGRHAEVPGLSEKWPGNKKKWGHIFGGENQCYEHFLRMGSHGEWQQDKRTARNCFKQMEHLFGRNA